MQRHGVTALVQTFLGLLIAPSNATWDILVKRINYCELGLYGANDTKPQIQEA